MHSEALLSSFSDGSCVDISFSIDSHLVVIEINEEKQQQRYRLHFEECIQVGFIFTENTLNRPYNLDDIFDIEEQTPELSAVRYFRLEFFDDSIIQIQCGKFWMEPIDGFWLHANPPQHQ
jgi:hypothetical protein